MVADWRSASVSRKQLHLPVTCVGEHANDVDATVANPVAVTSTRTLVASAGPSFEILWLTMATSSLDVREDMTLRSASGTTSIVDDAVLFDALGSRCAPTASPRAVIVPNPVALTRIVKPACPTCWSAGRSSAEQTTGLVPLQVARHVVMATIAAGPEIVAVSRTEVAVDGPALPASMAKVASSPTAMGPQCAALDTTRSESPCVPPGFPFAASAGSAKATHPTTTLRPTNHNRLNVFMRVL